MTCHASLPFRIPVTITQAQAPNICHLDSCRSFFSVLHPVFFHVATHIFPNNANLTILLLYSVSTAHDSVVLELVPISELPGGLVKTNTAGPLWNVLLFFIVPSLPAGFLSEAFSVSLPPHQYHHQLHQVLPVCIPLSPNGGPTLHRCHNYLITPISPS
jgi:hypothetical protein